MPLSSLFTDLHGIQGWGVLAGGIRIEDDGSITVPIQRCSCGYRCGQCGEGLSFAYNAQAPRRIRDFPIWGREWCSELEFVRVDCPECGVVIEGLDWVERYARQTVR